MKVKATTKAVKDGKIMAAKISVEDEELRDLVAELKGVGSPRIEALRQTLVGTMVCAEEYGEATGWPEGEMIGGCKVVHPTKVYMNADGQEAEPPAESEEGEDDVD